MGLYFGYDPPLALQYEILRAHGLILEFRSPWGPYNNLMSSNLRIPPPLGLISGLVGVCYHISKVHMPIIGSRAREAQKLVCFDKSKAHYSIIRFRGPLSP